MTFQVFGISKFVIGFLASLAAGVFLGDLIPLDFAWAIGLAIGLVTALVIWRREKIWFLMMICMLGLSIGLGYFNFWDIRQRNITLPFKQEIAIEGQIINHPDFFSNQSRFQIKFQNQKIQVTTGRYPEYHYGDILKFTGIITKPNDYLFHQGILGVVYNPTEIIKTGENGNRFYRFCYLIRDRFEKTLNQTLSEPYASFAAGLILGSKRNIPDSLMSDFNRTGTTHIIAVSGYNLTIMIVYLGLFLGLFGRKVKFWGSLLIIFSFVVMTGAPASVIRAGILASLVALGHFEGRRINMTILLLLVANVMLFFNAYAIKFDISFQLSFLAFIGLVYLSDIIANLKFIKFLPTFLKSTLSETLSAQIMVLPILVFYFGRLSIISPVVNILILWIIPATMALIFVIVVAGLIWLPLGQAFGFLGFVFLKYIIVIVEGFSKLSWASYELKTASWWWMVISFFIIGVFMLKYGSKSRIKMALKNVSSKI